MTRFFDNEWTFVPEVRPTRHNTALLVVDMQYNDASEDQGLNLALEKIEPGCMDYFNERNETQVIPTITSLISFFRQEQLPIIYLMIGSDYRDLRDFPSRLRAMVRQIEEQSGVPDVFWSGNPAYSIRAELAPKPEDTIVKKTSWGAFNSSNIDHVLHQSQVANLVITGISTNACVETTARDAADRGYGCVIVEDATADYAEEAHDASLRAFFFNFGRVTTADGVKSAITNQTPI